MKVLCICWYLTRWTDEVTGEKYEVKQGDWDAKKFIDAFKPDRTINKYASIPVNGSIYRLEESNRADAVKWFGDILARRVKPLLAARRPVVLVPIPCKAAVRTAPNPGPCALASSLRRALTARGVPANTADALRWKEAVKSAKEGGPRNPAVLAQHLYVTRSLDKSAQYVLVDDVTTSGGHLEACAALLQQAGVRHIPCAAIAGRSVQLPPENAWEVPDENVS